MLPSINIASSLIKVPLFPSLLVYVCDQSKILSPPICFPIPLPGKYSAHIELLKKPFRIGGPETYFPSHRFYLIFKKCHIARKFRN